MMKFLVSFHFGILWNYVSELFQTRLRSFAIGMCLTVGLVFQALGTYFVAFARAIHVHPLVVSVVFVAGSLMTAFFAPETQGKGIKV